MIKNLKIFCHGWIELYDKNTRAYYAWIVCEALVWNHLYWVDGNVLGDDMKKENEKDGIMKSIEKEEGRGASKPIMN